MQLFKLLAELRREKERLTHNLEQLNKRITEAEKEAVSWLENKDMTQVKDDNYTFFLRGEVYARMEQPSVTFAYLRELELGDIIKETIHAKTLSALVKQRGEIPGVVAHYETKIGYRKVGDKEGGE